MRGGRRRFRGHDTSGQAGALSLFIPVRQGQESDLGADLALNYKTDDIPSRLREFSPEGIDVWFETQREPDLEVSIPLLRPRGRMIPPACSEGEDRYQCR